MLYEIISDEELVQTFQGGDLSALDILLKRYEVLIRSFILSFSWLTSPDLIDDIIQEIFITVFKELKNRRFKPKDKGSFKGWIYNIARHRCLNATERLKSQPKTISQQYLESFPADLEKTRYYDEPDELTGLQELEAELHRILGQLSDEERQLLMLVDEGKTYPQIRKLAPFNKYSIVNLRRMVCDARTFIYKEVEKWRKKRKT